jgi:hypothetical protein
MNVFPVATREGREPERHHRREVERSDRRADSHGLPEDVAVDAGGDLLEAVAGGERGRPAGDLDALDAAAHAPARLVERLAVLGRDDPRELLEVVLEKLPEAEHRPRAQNGRRIAPGGERLLRRGDGGRQVLPGREGSARDRRSRRGIVDVERLGGTRSDPLSAEEVFEDRGLRRSRTPRDAAGIDRAFHHGPSPWDEKGRV